jgi:hypothetical protein
MGPDVCLLAFTIITFRGIWGQCDLSMSMHQHVPVDRKAVRK